MRRLSIKLKMTLWFMAFMLVLAVVVFVFVSLLSTSETRLHAQNALMSLVEANEDEVEYEDGEIELDDDFIAYRGGVYCLVFDGAGAVRGGRSPDDALGEVALEDGALRQVSAGGEDYTIYDLKGRDDRKVFWLRGIVSQGGGIEASSLNSAALLAIPLLILLAAIGGYMLARRSLRPIRLIGQTAEEIGSSGDLSKRIAIDENGDELHRLAGAFNRMLDQLERNFEAEKQFTSDASHELRTPITTILAQCEYAFENASGEEELYEVIGDIQKQGYRMSRLVESLLDFTRLEQRTEPAAFETIDLSACLQRVCQEQRALPEKNITLTEALQPGIAMRADATLISRMAENLIRNAYRYGRENGTIRVALSQSEGIVTLAVADDGIGIAPEELPKIWNRFYQVDRSRRHGRGAGLGLGLAMVRQIAQLHGGTVGVESEPGRGSTFTVRFSNDALMGRCDNVANPMERSHES